MLQDEGLVLDRVQQYREYAQQARREAEAKPARASTNELLKIAEEWDRLADDILAAHRQMPIRRDRVERQVSRFGSF